MLLNLMVEVPFLLISALVVMLTVYLDIQRGTSHGLCSMSTLQSSKAWLYLLYVVAVIVTFLRLWLRNSDINIPPELITIIYNWETTLMIAVSSILPWRLARNISKMQQVETKALKSVLTLIFIWVFLLVATIVAFVSSDNWTAILFVWRVFFMSCAIFEIITLVYVFFMLKMNKLSTTRTLVAYVLTTALMRSGIVITIVLKFATGIMDNFTLKIIHMLLVISGLLSYCYFISDREKTRARRQSQLVSTYMTNESRSVPETDAEDATAIVSSEEGR